MKKPHIVIVGAGFGGVYTARCLMPFVREKLIDLTVVSRTNYFLFTPLLHEVATGALRPMSISEPLREIFNGSGVMIYQGLVTTVDTKNRIIKLGGSEKEIVYDYLVVSTGAETNYYGTDGAKENTLPLKNLSDAVNIREKVINSFEIAAMTENPADKKRLLSFAVVGAGATGVETVAELSEFVREIRKRYYKKNKKYKLPEATVYLIGSGDEILKPFNQKIRKVAEKHLREIGVVIMLGEKVGSVGPGIINLDSGKKIQAETIIWAAGVKPTLPKFLKPEPETISDRLKTDGFLRMEGRDNVFVLGDSSGLLNGETAPLPMLAQVAVAQAEAVAKNIMASVNDLPLSTFKYKSRGDLISVGQWYAAGEIKGLVFHGRIAWWIWRTVYLFNFVSWEKRMKIAFEWTLNLFLPRDTTKIL